MADKNNYESMGLRSLLKLKKINLQQQAKLKEESKNLDNAIVECEEVKPITQTLSNSGGSKRVGLNGAIPKDLRVQFKVTRKWDQELLQDLAKDITGFPFKSEFVEDVRQSKKMQETDPETWQKIESALTTKINERPYISFIDPLQGDNDE
jgi:hypothetical protein|tara:strand:- start:2464 stop:2916 length:453 start_codon:yes stop_codon:yes gene_type:complete